MRWLPWVVAAAQSSEKMPHRTDWRLNVANLHVQKTGGTSFYLLCEALCPRNGSLAERQEYLSAQTSSDNMPTAVGNTVEAKARGFECQCRPLFDVHFNFRELIAFAAPSHEVDRLRQVFVAIDVDGSGAISRDEFKVSLPPCRQMARASNPRPVRYHPTGASL